MFKPDNATVNNVTSKSLADLIRTRRTINTFRPDPIPAGTIEALLEIAVYVPNHRLTEPWRFVYITGNSVLTYATIRRQMALPGFAKLENDIREKASEGVYRKFADVPAYLLVIMTVNHNSEIAEEDYASCACLIQNFLLLAWAQGIGSCWKTFKNDARLQSFVRLDTNEKVVGIIHLGYPDETPISNRKSATERLTHLP